MGWASGSGIMSSIIDALKPELGDDARRKVYVKLIQVFRDEDCDTLKECFDDDPVFVEAYCQIDPYTAGYEASAKGINIDANPHEAGTKAAREWGYGWQDCVTDRSES